MDKLYQILEQFDFSEPVIEIKPISNGFINGTYKICCEEKAYILQQINTNVFPNVEGLMSNVEGVTKHIYAKTGTGMFVIRTKNNKLYYEENDCFYRMYNFIEDSVAYNSVDDPSVFYQAGVGFGKFQNALADFDATQLFDVIENFHTTTKRFDDFMDALKKNVADRARLCTEEIAFLQENAAWAGLICVKLDSGELPYRVTHNDTKLNNILFSADTKEPICAVDLDTVMKGSVLYDVGDAIRYGANPAGELGTDAEYVYLDLELYRAFLSGFLRETHTVLTPLEIELLPESVVVMTYELALRFLEDYLRGDTYFGEAFEGINLQRARSQIDLTKDAIAKLPQMKEITKECLAELN